MHKSYYAIIPASVRYDNGLTPNAKLLYGEITALCNQEGYCWASNSYFAELYGVSKKTISTWINQLVREKHISSELKYKKGSKEIEDRYLRIVQDPIRENVNTPTHKKVKDNNTSLNTTSNNTLIPYVEIVNYLNDVAKKNYRHSTNKTKDLIKARWNEGFRLDDFKKVIDTKNNEWKNDVKMSRFIRPETLFSPKFEGYLNQKSKQNDEYDNLF